MTTRCKFIYNDTTNSHECSVCHRRIPAHIKDNPPGAMCGRVQIKKINTPTITNHVRQRPPYDDHLEDAAKAAHELGMIDDMESLPQQVKRYAKELAEWIRLGKPIRTNEQITACYKICSKCDKRKDPKDEPWIKRAWSRLNLIGDYVYCGVCKCGVGKKRGSGIANMAYCANIICKHPSGNKWAKVDSSDS